jgi:hypothetical protein
MGAGEGSYAMGAGEGSYAMGAGEGSYAMGVGEGATRRGAGSPAGVGDAARASHGLGLSAATAASGPPPRSRRLR